MRPIPLPLREKMAKNPFMSKCAYPDCFAHPEWEHSFTYAGKQINSEWAIVPICKFHHRGDGLDKDFNRWVAVMRAKVTDYAEAPKVNWFQVKDALHDKFKRRYNIYHILKLDTYKHT